MNKSARRGAQLVPIGMPTVCWKNTSTKHNEYVVNHKLEQVPVGSTGKDDSDLPKSVQVQIPSNVFRHSISEKSALQLSKRYNRSWYKTPQNRFQIIHSF